MTAAAADEYASLLEGKAQGAEPHASEAAPSSPHGFDLPADADRRNRLPPGTRVGDHLIVRGVLGEGGTAIVYEALHTRLGASVALKVIDVSDEFMEGAHARLLREAHVCASLEDPHIPRIYDVGELPDGTPYVVMERVSGRTLENVLVQGALPLDIAVQITEDLLLAVDAIERAGVVHRDIKPPNIILQTNAEGMLRIRLMDFGVSKNVGTDREPTQKTDLQANPTLTQQGAIVGTPHYMAPEQIVGPSVDSRADLYAVGVVAYEMMSGRTAFEGETTGDVVASVLHTRPTPLRKLRDVHEALESWVERAMSPRRSDRYQTARQMREALREAWEQHLDRVGAHGHRRWTKRIRVAGALGLVAVGMMLPVPSSYDSGLGRFLGRAPADKPGSADDATPVLSGAATMVGAPRPAAAEPPEASSEGWQHAQVGEPSVQAIAASEASRPAHAPGLAAVAGKPAGQLPTAVRPALATPGAMAPAPVGTLVARPLAAQPGPQKALAKPVDGAKAAKVQGPAEMQKRVFGAQPPAQGVLLNDYVQKLEKLTGPAPRGQAASPDRLPDNPYGD